MCKTVKIPICGLGGCSFKKVLDLSRILRQNRGWADSPEWALFCVYVPGRCGVTPVPFPDGGQDPHIKPETKF